jgi:hypothetical protein
MLIVKEILKQQKIKSIWEKVNHKAKTGYLKLSKVCSCMTDIDLSFNSIMEEL